MKAETRDGGMHTAFDTRRGCGVWGVAGQVFHGLLEGPDLRCLFLFLASGVYRSLLSHVLSVCPPISDFAPCIRCMV